MSSTGQRPALFEEDSAAERKPPAEHKQSPDSSPLRRWLSMGLIVVGLVALGFGGVLIYLNLVATPEPPPAVGLSEPPPSMDDNPLPVMLVDVSPAEDSGDSAPTPVPLASSTSPIPTLTSQPNGSQVEQNVPADPTAIPSPTFIPPASQPPTRIVAPAIDLDTEVVPVGWKQIREGGKVVSVWQVAEYAAGWHKNSALPGDGGNVVLSGHHNVKGEVFRYIVDLNPGDTITLYADGRPYTYTVETRFVVKDKGELEEKRRENARWIGPFPDERLTLVTCWPYSSNTHRVIVVAK